MIGSFWNLCRACPSMPVDKLHSEYRSTYRWHEYTGGARPEVVRRPPVPNQFGAPVNEPPLPRRKKNPELAYRTHEFMNDDSNKTQAEHTNRARPNTFPVPLRMPVSSTAVNVRPGAILEPNGEPVIGDSEERNGTPSRRSKSAGPPLQAQQKATAAADMTAVIQQQHIIPNGRPHQLNHETGTQGKAGESSGLFKKTISKLSTEYRLQFVWPHVNRHRPLKANVNFNEHNNDDVVDDGGGGGGIGVGRLHRGEPTPRKSVSLGTIKATSAAAAAAANAYRNIMPAGVHTTKKRGTCDRDKAASHELEPLFNNSNDVDDRANTEHSTFRKSVIHNQRTSDREDFGFSEDKSRKSAGVTAKLDNKHAGLNGYGPHGDSWYKEVIALRKKAGEYKCRGWGTEIDPDLYSKQKALWDQVSRRSSLSALSLEAASPSRPITKEEKEKENNKKSSPTKPYGRRLPGHAQPVDSVRHHLERTTGPDVEEGALLPSPTREKLMPTIPKSKEDDSYASRHGSPKKSATSRHGSPQKGSPQKSSPKKVLKQKGVTARSQSVGPTSNEAGSPKKMRSGSTVPSAPTPTSAKPPHKKTPASTPTTGERRPRPTSLSTTISHRAALSGSTGGSGAGTAGTAASNRAHSAPGNHHPITTIHENKKSNALSLPLSSTASSSTPSSTKTKPKTVTRPASKANAVNNAATATTAGAAGVAANATTTTHNPPSQSSSCASSNIVAAVGATATAAKASTASSSSSSTTTASKARPKSTYDPMLASTYISNEQEQKKFMENDEGGDSVATEKDGGIGGGGGASISSASPLPPTATASVIAQDLITEHIVKSPPEPTRVKSPEQILMRSPDPVNWTVPLDTGKTFTVTQNVREGEVGIRPQSEFKASTPVDKPPPPPQSAPPELAEQAKMEAWRNGNSSVNGDDGDNDDIDDAITSGQATSMIEAKPVPGITLRCLDDPSFDMNASTSAGSRNLATDVLEKARDRFDRFWGGSSSAVAKEENV